MTLSINARYARDVKCEPCHGTGRKGRGKCRACDGHGIADLRHPRIRFNWGYHDGAGESKLGRARTVVETGEQTTRVVSEERDWWYALGYRAGLADHAAGIYAGNSDPAWQRDTGGLPTTWR